MARTFVQQSQIRDTESKSDASVLGVGLESTTDLAGDLNALRSLIKDIKGEGVWYDEAGQNLAEIEAAMVATGADATFQGVVKISSDSAAVGKLYRVGADGEIAEETDLSYDAASSKLTVSGTGGLNVSAGDLVVAGGAQIDQTLAVDGETTLNAKLNVTSGGAEISGDTLRLDDANLEIAAAAGEAAKFSVQSDTGNTLIEGTLNSGDATLASAIVSSLSDGHVVLVGADSELVEDAKLTYAVDGVSGAFSLALDGSMNATGDVSVGPAGGPAKFSIESSDGSMSAASDKFSVDVDGAVDAANGAFVVGADGALTISDGAAAMFQVSAAGAVTAAGLADFNGGVEANSIKIDGDTAGKLYIVGADGLLKDEENLTFDAGQLSVTGDFAVSASFGITGEDGSMNAAGGAFVVQGDGNLNIASGMFTVSAAGAVYAAGDLTVGGNTISSSTAASIELSGADVDVMGDLTVRDNTIKSWSAVSSTATAAIELTGENVEVKGALQVSGDAVKDSNGDTVLSFEGDGSKKATFAADLVVAGDLTVSGDMTYIDTENLKVKDALIHLNVGGLSDMMDRGIMFHGDAAFDDVGFGVKAGASAAEFIFAKGVAAEGAIDGNNQAVLGGADLASAWMQGLKLGAAEGTQKGMLEYSPAGASPAAIRLSSDADAIELVAASDLMLKANGEAAISFIEADEYASFDAQFPGMSLVAAIVAAGGNFKQDSFQPGATTAGDAIDYSSVGSLRTASYASLAAKKLAMDVFLNGVRLAYGDDYSIDGSGDASPGALRLSMDTDAVVDVLTVVIHNAAV